MTTARLEKHGGRPDVELFSAQDHAPAMPTATPTPEIEAEADRLLCSLMHVECDPRGRTWNLETCREIAPLTLEINRLKKEKNAVILTHSYVEPEIIYGVGDFKGDSYHLSLMAKQAKAQIIVFVGVVFMAETAKILSPEATVVVPDRGSGCSLADSIDGDGVRKLKALYPDATVVCYINSTADVKAESDVCVTSGNVYAIVQKLPARRILFVPDRLMAENDRLHLKVKLKSDVMPNYLANLHRQLLRVHLETFCARLYLICLLLYFFHQIIYKVHLCHESLVRAGPLTNLRSFPKLDEPQISVVDHNKYNNR